MPLPQPITAKLDLDDDGVYEIDISAHLQGIDGPRLERDSAVDSFGPRKMTLWLDNDDGRFSPRNTASPYSPDLLKGKRVQVQAQITIAACTNLIRNPSAETNTTHWSADLNCTIDRRDGAARYGRYSIEIESSASGGVVATQAVAATADAADYSGTIYVRGEGATIGTTLTVKLREGITILANQSVTLSAHFQPVTLTGTFSGVGIPSILVGWTAVGAGEIVLTDGCQIEQASAATPYCDGDQPEHTWAGTAHASTSSRSANPTIDLFTGELREFNLEIDTDLKATARYECTGLTEQIRRTRISAGPFSRKPAGDIAGRILDILEGAYGATKGLRGEEFIDGGNRIGSEGIIASGGTTVDLEYDTGAAGDDPIVYDALEGDQVVRVTGIGSADDGWSMPFYGGSPAAAEVYHASVYVRAGVAASDGKDVKLRLAHLGGSVESSPATISDTAWTRLEASLEVPAGVSGPVSIAVWTDGAGWGASDEFWTDCHHMSQAFSATSRMVPFSLVGTKWTTELEYIDAYRRSANATLEELVSSAGGWIYEDGAGQLVLETYDRRDPAVVTVPTLRLSDWPEEGIFTPNVLSYNEPMASQAGTVKVGSFGDVAALPAANEAGAKQCWNLEPAGVVLAADEERTFFADHVTAGGTSESEGASGLIARRAEPAAAPIAGWATVDGVTTPWAKSYGRSSDVTIKAPGGGATVQRLILGCRAQHREQTERVFVTNGADEPVMELEMPAQGYKTTAMDDLATWAKAKYGKGPAVLKVEVVGDTAEQLLNIFGTEVGRPVYLDLNRGNGVYGLGGMFFVEGIRIIYQRPDLPRLRLRLEEA